MSLPCRRVVSFFARASKGRLRREGESRPYLRLCRAVEALQVCQVAPKGRCDLIVTGPLGGWTKKVANDGFYVCLLIAPSARRVGPGSSERVRAVGCVPFGADTCRWFDLVGARCLRKGSLAAVAGLWKFHQQAPRHVNRPRCAFSERQLAQLAAYRAYLLAMDFNIDIELAASRAIEQVPIACMGESVTFALEQLLMFGLELDASRDRVASQQAINLAESHGYAEQLRHLDIRPAATTAAW